MATFVAVGLAANSTTPPSLCAAAPAGYGCFVRGGVSFDPAGAFGISRREAAGSTLHRLHLEATYATLHGSGDAANCRAALTNDATGLYVGAGGLIVSSAVSTTDLPPTRKLGYQGTSQACSVASGRASFVLGLTGPCMSIDTACSSSLCAFHVAASALRNDECPRAAVTGVSVLIYQTSNAFATAGMLSDRGRCHTFDLRATATAAARAALPPRRLVRRGLRRREPELRGAAGRASASLTAPVVPAAPPPRRGKPRRHGRRGPRHGHGLGDPIEVGAAVGALCKDADGKVVHTIQRVFESEHGPPRRSTRRSPNTSSTAWPFPGVGYVEIAAASVTARGFDEEVALLDLTFVRPCVLTADIEFMCSRSEDGGFEVLSRAGKAGAFASHARGGSSRTPPAAGYELLRGAAINDARRRRGFFGTLPAGAPLTKPKTQGDTSFIPAVFGLVAVQGVRRSRSKPTACPRPRR
ncbi:hypothetical protein JL721_11744 [Aureococcus anophagefferens]|nr:hypothetical protein JL721_11744 [Aureococcus anophagefferens]